MLTNLPDWITAGTAITAVVGGLFGVYATTQSRMDVAEERWTNTIEVLERLSVAQLDLHARTTALSERVVVSNVSAEFLKEGQESLEVSLNSLTGEVRQLTNIIIEKSL